MNVSYEILWPTMVFIYEAFVTPFYCLFLIVRGFLAVICDQFTLIKRQQHRGREGQCCA